MNKVLILLTLLGWESEKQVTCFVGLAHDTGSPDFTFDMDNPVKRVASILHDLYYSREGEPVAEWRERQGVGGSFDKDLLTELDNALEGLSVMFFLMASKESLFTVHGVKNSAAWRFIRRIARGAQGVFIHQEKITEADVIQFLHSYEFEPA